MFAICRRPHLLRRVGLSISAIFLAAAINVFAAPAARAAAGDWVRSGATEVRLIAASDSVGNGRELPFGLEFRLQEGWKIYWRSPGDAGLPPRPDWSDSVNVAAVAVRWPLPHRYSLLGLETLGYADHVIFPLNVTPETPDTPLTLSADLEYLACAEICVPHSAYLSLTLDPGDGAPAAEAHVINRFAGMVPRPAEGAGVVFSDPVYQRDAGGKVRLHVYADAEIPFSAAAPPDLLAEGPPGSFFGKSRVTLENDGARAAFLISGGGLGDAATLPLTLTLYDAARAVEGDVRANPGVVAPAIADGGDVGAEAWGWVLAIAFLGGLVLNLMPCVLPVLSLKLLSALKAGSGGAPRIRVGFLAGAAGILSAFMLLAAALTGVKAAGFSIGWGIQFQQPWFLVFMILAMTLFAANLMGFFQFRLPGPVADIAGRAVAPHSLVGDFTSGLFATLLATPCSAPFVGTAVAFALAGGATEIFTIFMAMGLGLAAPWLLAALFPSAPAAILPRPGRWMPLLQRLLALALLATMLWLLTVLSAVAGLQTALGVGGMTLLIPVVLAVRRYLPLSRLGRIAPVLCAALVVAALSLSVVEKGPLPSMSGFAAGPRWAPFDRSAIDAATARGEVVFVDVTADWCLTCKVNKAVVLDRAPVANWLSGPGVLAMRADWTRPDPVIEEYLVSHGRYGIPYNAVYGPAAPRGVSLPEILTSQAVMRAVAIAGGKISPD